MKGTNKWLQHKAPLKTPGSAERALLLSWDFGRTKMQHPGKEPMEIFTNTGPGLSSFVECVIIINVHINMKIF